MKNAFSRPTIAAILSFTMLSACSKSGSGGSRVANRSPRLVSENGVSRLNGGGSSLTDPAGTKTVEQGVVTSATGAPKSRDNNTSELAQIDPNSQAEVVAVPSTAKTQGSRSDVQNNNKYSATVKPISNSTTVRHSSSTVSDSGSSSVASRASSTRAQPVIPVTNLSPSRARTPAPAAAPTPAQAPSSSRVQAPRQANAHSATRAQSPAPTPVTTTSGSTESTPSVGPRGRLNVSFVYGEEAAARLKNEQLSAVIAVGNQLDMHGAANALFYPDEGYNIKVRSNEFVPVIPKSLFDAMKRNYACDLGALGGCVVIEKDTINGAAVISAYYIGTQADPRVQGLPRVLRKDVTDAKLNRMIVEAFYNSPDGIIVMTQAGNVAEAQAIQAAY